MLDKHNPPVFGLDKIKYFFNLLAAVAESVFHDLARYVPLLVWEQNYTGALDVCTLQGFDPSRKPVMEYTEADDASFMFIGHVPPFILGTAAECTSIPLIFGQYCILVIKHYDVPSTYLGFQINRGNDFAGIHKPYSFPADFFLHLFPDWV